MMTSKESNYTLCSLLFETGVDYTSNLDTLLTLITNTPKDSLIVAPEVCLTGFAYKNLDEATSFANVAIEALLEVSIGKIIILTLLEKVESKVFNNAVIFHNGKIVYKRAKTKLFRLGNEHKHMQEGSDEQFSMIEVDGIKITIFICFELRFKELWQKAEGSDVIVTPSWWGKSRSEHFKSITKTLAIMNECYVVASDSLNVECSGLSGVISPQGDEIRNGNKPCLEVAYSKKDITLMRRYIDIGIQ